MNEVNMMNVKAKLDHFQSLVDKELSFNNLKHVQEMNSKALHYYLDGLQDAESSDLYARLFGSDNVTVEVLKDYDTNINGHYLNRIDISFGDVVITVSFLAYMDGCDGWFTTEETLSVTGDGVSASEIEQIEWALDGYISDMASATYFDNSNGFCTTPQALTDVERADLESLLRMCLAETVS